ncbi:MAG: P-type DNA transfer ATPase VirB11 [Caulobacterales bacterium 32-69-10]|nr:MAG: P-type DNA transfer ATPase VirB11 [Caulobacterales bacterium 32-69-10]
MNAPASTQGFYLQAYLAPFAALLERTDVTDIFVNRPGEMWVETLGGGLERHDAPDLDETILLRLARQIASLTHQGVSREHPLLSASLPGGERVQIVAPPATRGPMALAIRKQVVADLTLGDYAKSGALDSARRSGFEERSNIDQHLEALLDNGDVAGFLSDAVRARKNMVIAGGTSTGKTTFLNALLKEVPDHERLIVIEDTPEVQIAHANAVGLVAVRGGQGEARVTVEDLLQASLRMRPDRIIMGELRGAEAYSFLRAVNTGHPGSITTVHADSPKGALDQLALMVLQAGVNLGRTEIVDYVQGVVEVFVQLSRRDGRRVVSEIAFRPQG